MKFLKYDIGNLSRGEIVEINLTGSAANVQLLDSSNMSNYEHGRKYRYIGGLATKSPVHLQIPNSGHWYVAVDMNGLRGSTSASVRVLPNALPKIREQPLSSLPSLDLARYDLAEDNTKREYDVFVSHASEDKDEVVRPLVYELQKHGLKVWYDEFEMKIGDSLRRKIDKGLANSRFGIVVLSRNFLSKGWTNYELDGIVTKVNSGEQIMLPIWHNITKKEIIEFSPSLADKVARNTSNYTIEEIANEISEVVRQ
jgi:hypothetical protein